MPSGLRNWIIYKMRLLEIDSLRGIAAFGVVLFHFMYLYNDKVDSTADIYHLAKIGQYGPLLFYIISGFVITLTIKRCKIPTDFIVSRVARIYPAFWISVILTAIIVNNYTLETLYRSTTEIAVNLTMLNAFVGVNHVDGVYWTLANELLFYSAMYLFYRFNLLPRINHILLAWLSLQLASILIEQYYGWFPWKITFLLILGYIHLFAAGIIFFNIHNGDNSKYNYLLLVLCLVIQWVKGDFTESIYVTVSFLLFTLILLNKLKFIIIKPLIFLGSISYPLYLTHQNIGYTIIHRLKAENISADLAIITALITMISVSYIIHRYIELPGNRFIKKQYKTFKDK